MSPCNKRNIVKVLCKKLFFVQQMAGVHSKIVSEIYQYGDQFVICDELCVNFKLGHFA